MSQWIKCSERMPDERKYCLVFCPSSGGIIDCSVLVEGRFAGFAPGDVTHWQPLPAKPEEA